MQGLTELLQPLGHILLAECQHIHQLRCYAHDKTHTTNVLPLCNHTEGRVSMLDRIKIKQLDSQDDKAEGDT